MESPVLHYAMTHVHALTTSLTFSPTDKPVRISQPEAVTPLAEGADCSQSRWVTSYDGVELFLRFWRGCPGLPIVIYLHGIEGHSEWFAGTASHLNNLGLTVYAPDRRGAGRSRGERGHADSCSQWADDLELVIKQIRQEHGNDPIFLIANCWGAKVAIASMETDAVKAAGLSGLVLISPAISVLVDMDPLSKLAIFWRWLTKSKKPFPLPIPIDMFTDDPAYLEFIRQDPLRLTAATAAFLVENLKLGRLAVSGAERLTLPLLILQSGRDRIVNVAGIEDWYERCGSQDKQMYIFSWASHSLDFDEHRGEYARCLSEWLFAHAGGAL